MNQVNVNHQINLEKQSSFNYRRAYILFGLLVFSTIFYYAGELVDAVGWRSLHLSFFYSIHDIHRLLFFAPILYAGHYFSGKAVIIITIITAVVFIPRSLLISPYPDPVLRAETFAIIAGAVGYLIALSRSKTKRISHLEAIVRQERDKLLTVLERMADGIIIIGPDYKVRYANPATVTEFGKGIGRYCYEYLHQSNKPCLDCKSSEILNGVTRRWQYQYPNGKTYELQASPLIDSHGTICQLVTLRDITLRFHSLTNISNKTLPTI